MSGIVDAAIDAIRPTVSIINGMSILAGYSFQSGVAVVVGRQQHSWQQRNILFRIIITTAIITTAAAAAITNAAAAVTVAASVGVAVDVAVASVLPSVTTTTIIIVGAEYIVTECTTRTARTCFKQPEDEMKHQ